MESNTYGALKAEHLRAGLQLLLEVDRRAIRCLTPRGILMNLAAALAARGRFRWTELRRRGGQWPTWR